MAKTTTNPRSKITISLDKEAKRRLKLWAAANHASVSKTVTDWVHKLPVVEETANTTSAMLPSDR